MSSTRYFNIGDKRIEVVKHDNEFIHVKDTRNNTSYGYSSATATEKQQAKDKFDEMCSGSYDEEVSSIHDFIDGNDSGSVEP